MKSITIGKNDAGQRLDRFLLKAFPALPSGMCAKFIRTKAIKLNGKRAEGNTRLAEGDEISLYIQDRFLTTAGDKDDYLVSGKLPNILYEDDHIILAVKEAGLSVHEDETKNPDTLINRIKYHCLTTGSWNPDAEASFSPALCNRIDRNTGGIVIAAKTAEALRDMNEIIRIRDIDKYYLCLVHGVPNEKGTLKGYLKKLEDENRVIVRDKPFEGSKTAITEYRRLATKNGLSLCECHLITGRTHQIRAQMAHAGFPLLGDGKYGTERSRRKHQALFSYKLVFTLSNYDGVLSYLKGKVFTVNNVYFAGEYFHDMKY